MGETVGPYELQGELGRGAMAVVWRAYDPKIERMVALKEPLLSPGLDSATAAEIGARFVREGKAAGKLNHPGIVTIYNAEIYVGRPAIVMELIEGRTLADVIERERPSVGAVVAIIDQLLDAVAFAHSRGVVHRDIKPENVFVTDDGRVKLTDFGIASVSSAGTLTQAGQILGTPGYMAPEQIVGAPVDGRADIFAIGVIAYELLTGRNPFGATDGENPTTILYRVVHEEPPVAAALTADVPAPVAAIVARAMDKDPARRYQTAEEMRADLRTGSFTPTTATAAAAAAAGGTDGAPRKSRRGLFAVGGACALVLAVLAVVFSGGTSMGVRGGNAGALSVTMSSPEAGASFRVGDKVEIGLDPVVGASQVTILVNGDKVATLQSAPFGTTYTVQKEGDYEVKAIAENGSGGRSEVTRTFTVKAEGPAASTPAPPSYDPRAQEREVESTMRDWLNAWQAMDLDRYMSFYAPSFHADYKGGDGSSVSAWRDYKRDVFAKNSFQRVGVSGLSVRSERQDRVRVRFVQSFESSTLDDYGDKDMLWIRQGGRWLIGQEEWYAR